MIELLLAHGSDVNNQHQSGMSLLHHALRDRLKKLARVESGLLYISSNPFVISMETDISYKMSDSTRANFFKRSLAPHDFPDHGPPTEISLRLAKDGFRKSVVKRVKRTFFLGNVTVQKLYF